jgi:alanine dehydrogenase
VEAYGAERDQPLHKGWQAVESHRSNIDREAEVTLLLSRSDVQRALTMKDAIELVERGFVEFGEGGVDMPQRPVIFVPEQDGLATFMPAYIRGLGALAVKTVTAFKNNPQKGMPTIYGTVTLLDPETGVPLSIMDGGYLTAVRTGAASGVATKHLAREDARVAAIFGAGVQGRTQLEAICTVRDIEEVRVVDKDQKAAERFVKEMAGRDPIPAKVAVADSPQDALAGADVVATATTSPSPIFDGDDLSPGAHVNGVGSHAPKVRELDTKTVVRSKIVCDWVDACLVEAGDLLIPIEEGALEASDIHGGLAEVISGKLAGRESDEEITLFKSVGLAFQDAVTALETYRKARDMGLGVEFEF